MPVPPAALLLGVLALAALAAAWWWRSAREPYLIAPYTDLEEPGYRGSPYALVTCDGPGLCRPRFAAAE